MTTLPAALRDKVEFAPADLDWLHQLVGDWQLVADMSMADLVLWVWISVAPPTTPLCTPTT